ncbi:hypothetical protein MCFN_03225 [Mycoplasmopsis californica]|uniref:Uncharacterized protein n=1 Tax=Mycoplasmopsis californica TaxID=2113 RepID=A0A059XRX7_9BACT|nr:hypothetical protein [Mycoplasmopsis californica]AIA29755.1 hypothetical protein MCFN_03225 [Mycoplasmopsis californica]
MFKQKEIKTAKTYSILGIANFVLGILVLILHWLFVVQLAMESSITFVTLAFFIIFVILFIPIGIAGLVFWIITLINAYRLKNKTYFIVALVLPLVGIAISHCFMGFLIANEMAKENKGNE